MENRLPLSVPTIINLLQSLRNELIKEHLREGTGIEYFKKTFKRELTYVNRRFLKKELADLMSEPLDLVHYAGLINDIKATNAIDVAEGKMHYFYRDLDRVYKKYIV